MLSLFAVSVQRLRRCCCGSSSTLIRYFLNDVSSRKHRTANESTNGRKYDGVNSNRLGQRLGIHVHKRQQGGKDIVVQIGIVEEQHDAVYFRNRHEKCECHYQCRNYSSSNQGGEEAPEGTSRSKAPYNARYDPSKEWYPAEQDQAQGCRQDSRTQATIHYSLRVHRDIK